MCLYMCLRNRLLELINDEGLNPNQFYIKTRLGNGFLDKVGEKLKTPSIEKISKVFPHWNIDYLQTGNGEKYRKDIQSNTLANNKIQSSTVQQGNNITNNDLTAIKELMSPIFSLMENKDEQISEVFSMLKSKNGEILEVISILKSKDEQINRLIEIIEKSR